MALECFLFHYLGTSYQIDYSQEITLQIDSQLLYENLQAFEFECQNMHLKKPKTEFKLAKFIDKNKLLSHKVVDFTVVYRDLC
jgi:hypothetical protein